MKGELEDTIVISSSSTTAVQERGGARGDIGLRDTFIRYKMSWSLKVRIPQVWGWRAAGLPCCGAGRLQPPAEEHSRGCYQHVRGASPPTHA